MLLRTIAGEQRFNWARYLMICGVELVSLKLTPDNDVEMVSSGMRKR